MRYEDLIKINSKFLFFSDNLELVSLPEQLLDKFLQSLVVNRASTVSRRSAGLAILVHKLITGDARPSKVVSRYILMYFCMTQNFINCVF